MADSAEKSKDAIYRIPDDVKTRCLKAIRDGLKSDEFWPSMHAAEALTQAGHGDEVRKFLEPMLATQKDHQKRCGLARELARAGDGRQVHELFTILDTADSDGRIHAAESLYKIKSIGDGTSLLEALQEGNEQPLRMMAAAALGQAGNSEALAYLRENLSHADPNVAMISAWVLGRLGDVRDKPALRKSAANVDQPLARAFFEYALAQLREDQGQKSLLENLSNSDASIRIYAAEAAGPSRMLIAVEGLIKLLDDENVDVRIRSAQALLALAEKPAPSPHEDISVIVYEATAEHPRYTEGSIIELSDGSLLNATTEFTASTDDFARARIIGKSSHDGGRTWGEARELQKDVGKLNVLGTTLRWLPGNAESPRLGMIYSVTQGYDSIQVFLKTSEDDAKTFGEPLLISNHPGYNIVVSDRLTQLKSGRLIAPTSWTADIIKINHMVCFCYYSDDGGKTWQKGAGEVDLPLRGAMEPDVVELKDGRLLMIMRNQLGTISASYSEDAGETWSEPGTLSDLKAPESPATIRQIPSTGDLLLIWNDAYTPDVDHGGRRTPLTAAVSSDDGRTWNHVRNLESDSTHTYAYTSLAFIRDRAVMSYWDEDSKTGHYSSRFRSLPVSWFYGEEHVPKKK
ncbi:MAG: exo-alpha-sialidase [Planctomycetaceae bacterium]